MHQQLDERFEVHYMNDIIIQDSDSHNISLKPHIQYNEHYYSESFILLVVVMAEQFQYIHYNEDCCS